MRAPDASPCVHSLGVVTVDGVNTAFSSEMYLLFPLKTVHNSARTCNLFVHTFLVVLVVSRQCTQIATGSLNRCDVFARLPRWRRHAKCNVTAENASVPT